MTFFCKGKKCEHRLYDRFYRASATKSAFKYPAEQMPVSQAPHPSYQNSGTNGVNFRTLHVNRPFPEK